jgi:GDPmannose 4,6-dehydratase
MPKRKIALITGVTGQDGADLAELLLKKGYLVHGVKRPALPFKVDRIDPPRDGLQVGSRCFVLRHGDVTDASRPTHIVQTARPEDLLLDARDALLRDKGCRVQRRADA